MVADVERELGGDRDGLIRWKCADREKLGEWPVRRLRATMRIQRPVFPSGDCRSAVRSKTNCRRVSG